MGGFIGMLLLIALLAGGLNGSGARTEPRRDPDRPLQCQSTATAESSCCSRPVRCCKDLTLAFDVAEATLCSHRGTVGEN